MVKPTVSLFAICWVEQRDNLIGHIKSELKIVCVEEPFVFSVTCPFANSAHFPAGYCVISFVFVGAAYTEGISP